MSRAMPGNLCCDTTILTQDTGFVVIFPNRGSQDADMLAQFLEHVSHIPPADDFVLTFGQTEHRLYIILPAGKTAAELAQYVIDSFGFNLDEIQMYIREL